MADPPWPYATTGPVGTGGRGAVSGVSALRQVGIAQHYPSMSLAELRALDVRSLAASQAHLYLWTTNSFIVEAHALAQAWGFTPKTVLTWVKVRKDAPAKPSMKTGYYFRGATEHIVFAVRGALRLQGAAEPTAFLAPREGHSVKPQMFFDLAMRQSPGPYLEMFARRQRPGWECWGNEVASSIVMPRKGAA